MDNRMCANPSCGTKDLIPLIRDSSFCQDVIVDPYIVKEPLLVNGYTSIFKVAGKVYDNSESEMLNNNLNKKQVQFRIVRNTHVHVTNTVIIDTEKDIVRKIEEKDPSTIRKLLDSQKMSATKRLNNFIENITKGNLSNSGSKSMKKLLNNPTGDQKLLSQNQKRPKLTQSSSSPQQNISKMQFLTAKNPQKLPMGGPNITSTSHPNLKIASVTSMNESSQSPTTNSQAQPLQQTNSLPVISSVQSVQSSSALVPQPITQPALTEQEKSEFQKMREEILELKELLKQIGGSVRRQD